MQITLNGEPHQCGAGETVEALMERLKLDGNKAAVELNLAIIPRSRYANTSLAEGDAVEIVRFIGGG